MAIDLLKNSSFYLLSSFITVAVNFFTLPFFTRYLTPSDYGVIALYIIFGSVCANILSVGLQLATYRYYFKLDNNQYKILNTSIVSFLIVIFLISWAVVVEPNSKWFSSTIFDHRINEHLINLAFYNGCLGYFYIYFSHLLAAQKRAKNAAALAIMHVCTNAIITAYLIVVFEYTYLAAIYSITISNTIYTFVGIYLNKSMFSLNVSIRKLKSALSFSYPEVPNIIIGLAYSSIDKAMLNKYKGISSVGYYEFATKFANLQKIFMDAISKSWAPYFMENAEARESANKILIVKRFYELAVLFMFFGLGVVYFTEEALIILTTEEFYDAKFIAPFLVLFYQMGILGFLSVQQIMFAEKLIYNLPVSLLGVFINIVLNLLLIPDYGAIGAAIATAITSMISSILLLYLGNKAFNLPIQLRKLVSLYLINCIFVLSIYLIFTIDNIWIKIILKSSFLGLFVYICAKLNYYKTADMIAIAYKIKTSIVK